MANDPEPEPIFLGSICVPPSFENDLSIMKLYQSFSTEILRLSLLGVAAVSTLVMYILNESGKTGKLDGSSRNLIILPGLSFGIAATAALVHRYVSSDSIACELVILRSQIRNAPKDKAKVNENKAAMRRMFIPSERSLWVSSAGLALGALLLVAAMANAIRSLN